MFTPTKMDWGGPRIVIFDDVFPNPLSGFRIAEYNFYFEIFPNLRVLCSTGQYECYKHQYDTIYPDYADRYMPLDNAALGQADLCYVNFLNNAYAYLPYIKAISAPFVFTLYPGGGFNPRDVAATEKLKKVLSTPLLRGVISTQRITSTVLRELRCPAPIHEIYGSAINPIYTASTTDRIGKGDLSDSLSICFAAFNYGDHGRAKGYREFIAAAELIADRSAHAKFSVVGNFSPDDVPLSPHLERRLRFCGTLSTPVLRNFFLTQDIIISPNAPYRVGNSAFDGFPTATCVEASLCGVAIICADELNQNIHYNEDEIVICETDPECIFKSIEPYVASPGKLRSLGERGRAKSMQLFNPASQLVPRAQALRQAASKQGRSASRRYGSSER